MKFLPLMLSAVATVAPLVAATSELYVGCYAGDNANRVAGDCTAVEDHINDVILPICTSSMGGGVSPLTFDKIPSLSEQNIALTTTTMGGGGNRRLIDCDDEPANPTLGEMMAWCLVCPGATFCFGGLVSMGDDCSTDLLPGIESACSTALEEYAKGDTTGCLGDGAKCFAAIGSA